MKLESYVAVEESLSNKLQKTWRSEATKLYAKMLRKVEQEDFDGARKLVEDIDLTEVGTKNKAAIRSHLRAAMIYGARNASGLNSSITEAGQYKELMDRVEAVMLASLEWNATAYTVKAALQSIARAEKTFAESEQVVKKAATKKRFVQEFVSFQKDGDDMIQLVSSLHTNRLATYGFTAEAEVLGIETYKLVAVLDGRTSEFCRMINGHTFQVSDARDTILQVLSLENPDDAKFIQPWPNQSKANMAEFSKMTTAELTALNLHIPPFHPGCRTVCVPVSKALIAGPSRILASPDTVPVKVNDTVYAVSTLTQQRAMNQLDKLANGKTVLNTDVAFSKVTDTQGAVTAMTNVPAAAIKEKEVNFGTLVPTQDEVGVDGVAEYIAKIGKSQEELPLVVVMDGKYYVQDGHHRLVALYLQKKRKVAVRLAVLESITTDDALNMVFNWVE